MISILNFFMTPIDQKFNFIRVQFLWVRFLWVQFFWGPVFMGSGFYGVRFLWGPGPVFMGPVFKGLGSGFLRVRVQGPGPVCI